MEKETLNKILDLLIEVAGEQATREFSGINWYNDFAERLNKVRSLVNPQTNPDETSNS